MKWIRDFTINVLGGLVGTAIVAVVGVLWARENLQSIIAEGVARGVEIIDLQQASDSLADIGAACSKASDLLTAHHPRLSTDIIIGLRSEFSRLLDSLRKASLIEYYSGDEIRKLAEEAPFASDKAKVIEMYTAKPKKTTTGLQSVEPQLAKIAEMLESLDRQLDQEPWIDTLSLQKQLSNIERMTTEVKASLDSRKAATLSTLKAVETNKGR